METETKNRKMSILINLKVIEERYEMWNLGLVGHSNQLFLYYHAQL